VITTSVPGNSICVNCIKLHVAIMPIFRTERFTASLILIGRNFFSLASVWNLQTCIVQTTYGILMYLVLRTFLQLLCDTVLIGSLSVDSHLMCARDITTTYVYGVPCAHVLVGITVMWFVSFFKTSKMFNLTPRKRID